MTDSTNNPPPATPDPAVPPPADPDAPLAGGPDGGGTHGDDPGSPAIPAATASETEPGEMVPKNRQRVGASGVVIALLLALLGFTLVVQVQNNATDKQFSSARQDDLVRLLSDLDALQERQRQDIATLEQTRQELASGAAGREAALNQAGQRADALGILAGTLPAQGPGVIVRLENDRDPITASHLLNAVQELRVAGAEAMQIDAGGRSVRITALTYFVDVQGGILVDGQKMTSPYTITAIGDPPTMRTAMRIVGGVVARVSGDGGNVSVTESSGVLVNTRAPAPALKNAQPVS